MKRTTWLTIGSAWLAAFLAACAPQKPAPPPVVVKSSLELTAQPAPPAPTRDPALRQIDPARDAAKLERIEACRAKLPAENRSRNNFAWAEAEIAGLDKAEYFAHSGIQDLSGLSTEAAAAIAGISLKPAPGAARFRTLCVNQNDVPEGADCWQRDVDTEFKILEDVAARLPDPAAAGRICLFTELYPCISCWNVMKQFLAAYPNVELEVLYRTP